jgi:hypothetical protein
VTAELPKYCFGQMTVSVNGHQLDGTLDPGSWQELVDEVADAHR